MRNITQDSLTAFERGRYFSRSNMRVSIEGETVYMFLHGNLIAKRHVPTGEVWVSNAGWFSNTTKERLNAVLWNYSSWGIHARNGDWVLGSMAHGESKTWDGDWISINDLQALNRQIDIERSTPKQRRVTIRTGTQEPASYLVSLTQSEAAAHIANLERKLPYARVSCQISYEGLCNA